jgi:hypothetical protein
MTVDFDKPILSPAPMAPAPVRCEVCRTTLRRESAIATESACALVFLCGLACHGAWRRSAPVTDRLACQGEDLARRD